MTQAILIGIGAQASATERAVAAILATRLGVLTDATIEVVTPGDEASVILGTPRSSEEIARLVQTGAIRDIEGLGDEGFLIAHSGETTIVAAREAKGVVYGVGRLLRDGRVEDGSWQPPSIDVRDRPKLAVRCIYFADHMGNWYSHADPQDVREYLEDMALWGYNELMTCLAVRPGETFFRAIERMHALEDYARLLGMRVGAVVQSNTSYDRPRDEWRATPGPIPGAYDVCPSQPGAGEFLIEDKRQYLALMQPHEYICLWPYDGGGCFCSACAPWAKTFLHLSRDIAEQAIGDASEVRVSAWFFERDVPGEDEVFFSYLEEKPSWLRYLVAGTAEARRWVRGGRSIPDPYRVLVFPDISMFDGIPWGGRGANAAPRKFAAELADTREMLAGGIVYSEGRYDDLNKILWARMLWDPDLDPAQIVREYCTVYLGTEGEPATELILAIERDMEGLPDPERWRRGAFHPEWDVTAEGIEGNLPVHVTEGWRWQLLRSKTRIEAAYDAVHEDGRGAADRAAALDVLRKTYEHLQRDLNLHDPERSLPTWIYAPVEEAFPMAAQGS